MRRIALDICRGMWDKGHFWMFDRGRQCGGIVRLFGDFFILYVVNIFVWH
jgi:hypothetical protein